jgi:transcriptional regulator with XRE-family HTH domain
MSFSELIRDARTRDDYWIEDALLAFTMQLHALMKKQGLSQKDLAEKIGVKQPYIARLLKGRENLTVATMVKLSRALGANLRISVQEGEDSPEGDDLPGSRRGLGEESLPIASRATR